MQWGVGPWREIHLVQDAIEANREIGLVEIVVPREELYARSKNSPDGLWKNHPGRYVSGKKQLMRPRINENKGSGTLWSRISTDPLSIIKNVHPILLIHPNRVFSTCFLYNLFHLFGIILS
jgi:hypothetical protein